MTGTPPIEPTDEMLVAFIDGELGAADREAVRARVEGDGRVAARLEALKAGGLPFGPAFEALLAQAPVERLAALVPRAVAADDRPREPGRPHRRWLLAAACVAAGVALDRSLSALGGDAPSAGRQDWRAVVAAYMMLYSADTLDGPTPDPGPGEMARLSDLVGVDVDLAKVALSGAAIRRAQVLRYGGAPLAQIAYLDPATGPLAFCFIRQAGRPEDPRSERRLGMTVVYWSTPTHAFLVIGHGSGSALETIASDLRGRFPA